MYAMNTPTWQLSTLPRWLHHCRFTPTECVPRLGKLLGSKAIIPSGSPNRSATWPTNTATKGRWSHGTVPMKSRSEERRVGKECRSRCDWSSDVCSSDLIKGDNTIGFAQPLGHLAD